jgi:uroporphyrinogen-III decarboxylase
MNSRERLLRTLKGERVDRVPISLYEFDGFYKGWVENEPEYVEILKYAEGKTDKMYFWAPEDSPESILFYSKMEKDRVKTTRWTEGSSTFTKKVIETPLGSLSALYREEKGIHTVWTIKPLCENEEDAKKVLGLPYNPWRPKVDSFFKLDRELGGSGILLGDIPDALCSTADILGTTNFLRLYARKRSLVYELMDFFQERVCNYLDYLLKEGAVTLYRIVGPEYAAPPFMKPEEFERLVTPYDKELASLLHKYGGFARLHCHGKIKKMLEPIRQIGIDAIDPLEPPPDGDVELSEAREVLGSKVALMGNIEVRLLENGEKTEIESQVRKAIKEGASTGSFVLLPTAMPFKTPMDTKAKENIIHYIDCGIRYGKTA